MKAKPIADMSGGVAPSSIFLHSSGRLYSADGPVPKRLRLLFRAWNKHLKARGQPALKGAQPVCIVHRRHLQALWDQARELAQIRADRDRYWQAFSRIRAKEGGRAPYTPAQLRRAGRKSISNKNASTP